ncbi:conserved hypothetical protein [Talaromyces stipitatus ATCC 10500]|uniref:Uncharacterized protein n=1 Tax=Talaromyces stipitatus (strain ATCC 10500 / CBS 375.48 / QM 6759 / NRRL 1006) TaxID=441959 RepID=B8M066_TALSN|nr:uncharacterized protein TSTA_083950 [Talaromyces stipitatus ATCC 10500]EED21163.1 conserved hypothetical protein [Talaromyces stipitatus ATCC 10500]
MSSKIYHRIHSHEGNELPTTPVENTTRHAPNARRVATTTKASRKSSVLTNSKRRKYPSSPDWDSQITLTQFVPKTEASDAGSGLVGYDEDGTERKSAEVIDLVDDADENDQSWRPSNRRLTKRQSTGSSHSPNSIPSTTFKSRSSSVLISGGPKISKFTRDKNNKGGNKTLTQMDFVRRFIPLPDSDDGDLNLYDEKSNATREATIKPLGENKSKNEFEDLTPRKRRKFNDETMNESPAIKSKTSPDEKKIRPLNDPSVQPMTPQKGRRFEIPSSQTPESPQQMFVPTPNIHRVRQFPIEVSSSSARKATDAANDLQNTAEQVPEETMQPENSKSQASDFPDGDIVASTMTPSSQLQQASTDNQVALSESDAIQPTLQPPEPPPEPPPSTIPKKTIVYDTDEDTDYDDLEDDNLPEVSIGAKALEEWAEQIDSSSEDHNSQNCDFSDNLPPIPNSGTDLEITGNILSDAALPSESSVYYRRPARYTQYPNEPVPILNTQKIAELFPVIEDNDDPNSTIQTSVSSTKEPPASSVHDRSDAFGSETATPTQDDCLSRSIQMIPESSPITRNYETRSVQNTMGPPARESIVLVESSQLVDRLNRQNESNMDTGKSLRKLFSTKDFLTDSVMESVPAPPWMASQDSIGEPYPDKDGRERAG